MHTTFQVGRLRCHALEAGRQALDGGAMFGVVPKPLWQRRIPADDRNRIPLALRCLLIEHDDGLVLVDTGLGNKEDAKFKDIYGVVNEGKDGRTCLEDALAELGQGVLDRKSTRLNSSHVKISYAVFCLKKKKNDNNTAHAALRVGECGP